MNAVPLMEGADLAAPLAWHQGQPITRAQYLADVRALAALLPARGPMLNITHDRYRFAVGLGAAMQRGQNNLLPPNHTTDTVARLAALFPGAYALCDDGAAAVDLPVLRHPRFPVAAHDADDTDDAEAGTLPCPQFAADALAAQVLTSGSTGAPVPHPKAWGLLVRNARSGAARLAQQMGRESIKGCTIVATVPAQHMYGFESSVLVALVGGAAFDTERPFYPADIAAALARAPRPRLLVTTPLHLKTLVDAGIALPQVDLIVSATAPLSPQLAARAEAAFGAPLMEIYGCTEAGQVASRRTTRGDEWQVYDGLRLSGDGEHSVVQGGHVPQPVPLADVLEVLGAQTFRLLGRANDLVNVAGKRSSLSHLNYHLNAIEGVRDGAFWLPPQSSAQGHTDGVVHGHADGVVHGHADGVVHGHADGVVRGHADGVMRGHADGVVRGHADGVVRGHADGVVRGHADGVVHGHADGVVHGHADGVVRLVAFVVAPGVSHAYLRSALRERVDPAFLPRRLIDVPALPREATGKLPAGVLDAWAPLQLAALRERTP